MDVIDQYILCEEVLKSMRVVNIEGMSPELDKAAFMLAWAYLAQVAKEIRAEHSGEWSFTAAAGESGNAGEKWNLQVHVVGSS